tara:strand:+ start:292 stop:1077 length:786 start_codon:yes stop_codon:yes gene_type:complete
LQNRRKSDHNALAARAALDEANEERRHLERLLERQRSDAQLQLEAAEQKFEERTKALRRRFEDLEQQREASAAALARAPTPFALSGANAASAAGSSQISDAYVDSADLAHFYFFVLRSLFFVPDPSTSASPPPPRSILDAANKDNVYYRSANKELKRKLREKTTLEQRSTQELNGRERECSKLRETNTQLSAQNASLKAIIKRSFAASPGDGAMSGSGASPLSAVPVRVDRSRLQAVNPSELAAASRRQRPSSASSAGARF